MNGLLGQAAHETKQTFDQAGLVLARIPRRDQAIRWVVCDKVTFTLGRSFAANAVRLQVRALAFGNFLRTLAIDEAEQRLVDDDPERELIQTGAKVVSRGRYIAFQMAEVAISRHLLADILRMIAEL